MGMSLTKKFAAATSMGSARDIRKLPKQVRDKFKEVLERSNIPDNIDFETIARISSNVTTGFHFSVLLDLENKDLMDWWYTVMAGHFEHIGTAFETISKSSKPVEYAEFLSREGFSIVPFIKATFFLTEMWFLRQCLKKQENSLRSLLIFTKGRRKQKD